MKPDLKLFKSLPMDIGTEGGGGGGELQPCGLKKQGTSAK